MSTFRTFGTLTLQFCPFPSFHLQMLSYFRTKLSVQKPSLCKSISLLFNTLYQKTIYIYKHHILLINMMAHSCNIIAIIIMKFIKVFDKNYKIEFLLS